MCIMIPQPCSGAAAIAVAANDVHLFNEWNDFDFEFKHKMLQFVPKKRALSSCWHYWDVAVAHFGYQRKESVHLIKCSKGLLHTLFLCRAAVAVFLMMSFIKNQMDSSISRTDGDATTLLAEEWTTTNTNQSASNVTFCIIIISISLPACVHLRLIATWHVNNNNRSSNGGAATME